MIYFDSGATTLQKPLSVQRSVMRAIGGLTTPGRGNYAAAQQAAQISFRCRSLAAELFDADSPEQVVFTMNATHGLNIAIKSLIVPGGTALISGYEHNAVTRPLEAIGARVHVAAAPLFQPEKTLEAFDKNLDTSVQAVIVNHVSNVFGYIQPVNEIAALCQRKGVPLIVDASQSAGILPVSVRQWQAAFVAMPGHKGLYGPQGTGLLLVNHPSRTLLEGGTGSQSLLQTMPEELPDRLEGGTQNMPGIAGLYEGLRFVKRQGTQRILRHERRLTQRLLSGLESVPDIRCFSAPQMRHQSGVLSFLAESMDSEELGDAMAQQGFALRSGLHCAPLAHATAGTLQTGTIRFSPSVFNTEEEVDLLLRWIYKKFKK